MSVLTISHTDWELLEDVQPGAATFIGISATQFQISVPMGTKTALFTIGGSFTNPAGMDVSSWLNTVSGTVTSIGLSIDGVDQLNATGLALSVSEVIDDATTRIHDVVETAIGGKALITGSIFDDHISGNGGDDSISGGHGNDDLFGDLGDDSIVGGSGNDNVDGGGGNDFLYGGIGDDSVYGGSGNDRLNGNAGNDYLSGGGGNDIYYVDSDLDRISESSLATGGVDVEYSSVSESGLALGVEKLVLTGSAIRGVGNAGNNSLTGNAAANQLSGGAGNDYIAGGDGNDSCVGGLGDDRLIGGRGADRLYGDSGRDIFDFNRLSELGLGSTARDAISNFVRGEDRIDLSTIDADSLTANDQAFEFVSAFSEDATGQVKYSNGLVQISTDADGLAEYEIALIGIAPSTLAATDFIL